MKITIERKSFIDALGVGGSMSGKNKGLPILDTSKITIKGHNATISSFDGEVAIALSTPILDVEGDITFCINTTQMGAILKTLRDEKVVLDVSDSVCVIEHSKGTMELRVESSDDFPTPSKDDTSVALPINTNILLDWVKKAKRFIDLNDLRPILGGMYLYSDGGGEMGCAATNTFKLYWDYIKDAQHHDGVIDSVVTYKAMDALIGMLESSSDGVISVIFSDNNVSFKTSNARLLCRKISGKYPSFKSIIPKENNIKVDVNIEDFKDAINRALLMSGMSHLIKLTIGGIAMQVESCDFDYGKKNIEEVACSASGDITIGFNGAYLLDCLNVIEGDEVSIEMSESSRPIVFKEGDKTIILMPMRIA